MPSDLQKLRSAFAARDWQLATELCQKILTADPHQVDAHMVMGLMAGQHGHIGSALRAFERVLSIDPSRLDARIQLARCLVHKGEHQRAKQQADVVAESQASERLSAKLLDLLATVYSHIGLQQQALTLYQRCLSQSPDSVPYLSNIAGCLIFLGHKLQAKEHLLRALTLQPGHPRLHWQLARLEACNSDRINAMQAALSVCPDTDRQGQIFLHYALGKACEDQQQWQAAWQYYESGSTLQRQRLQYQPAADRALFQQLQQQFNHSWFNAMGQNPGSAAGDTSSAPIFVIGLPRSGTTLVERIISSHSQVQSLGELQHIPIETKKLSGIQTRGLLNGDILTAVAGKDLQLLADHYLQAIGFLRNSQPRFVDKLPQNSLYVGLLAKAFPKAHFVCLHREPMDNCWALYKQLFADAYYYSYDLDELAAYVQQHQMLMQHWQQCLPDRFHTLSYETLVNHQEQTTRELLQFLQLEFEPDCLDFTRNTSAAATASAAQVRSSLYNHSINKWTHYSEKLARIQQYFA